MLECGLSTELTEALRYNLGPDDETLELFEHRLKQLDDNPRHRKGLLIGKTPQRRPTTASPAITQSTTPTARAAPTTLDQATGKLLPSERGCCVAQGLCLYYYEADHKARERPRRRRTLRAAATSAPASDPATPSASVATGESGKADA